MSDGKIAETQRSPRTNHLVLLFAVFASLRSLRSSHHVGRSTHRRVAFGKGDSSPSGGPSLGARRGTALDRRVTPLHTGGPPWPRGSLARRRRTCHPPPPR